MCQLLAMSCQEPASINFSLEGFHARGGRTDEHKDGWGMAFFTGELNGPRLYHDHQPAAWSPLLQEVKAATIKATTVLAHIRKATYGDINLRNCHPFSRRLWGQTWAMSHNGDLHHFYPRLTGDYVPLGETDSERAFCYLLDQLVARFPWASEWFRPSDTQLFAALNEISAEIACFGNFNLLLSNGDFLFSHCSTKLAYVERRFPFSQASLIDAELSMDLSAHNAPTDRMVILATTPLTHDEPWVILDKSDTLLLRAGTIIKRGSACKTSEQHSVNNGINITQQLLSWRLALAA